MDGQAVGEGEEVAGCKVTPVAVPGRLIERAEQLCRERGPVIELLSLRPLKTFLVATEPLKPKTREPFRSPPTASQGRYAPAPPQRSEGAGTARGVRLPTPRAIPAL